MQELLIMIEILRLFDKIGLTLDQQAIVHNLIMEFKDKNLKKECKMSKKEL